MAEDRRRRQAIRKTFGDQDDLTPSPAPRFRFGPPTTRPEFDYAGDEFRNPFEMPLEAYRQPMRQRQAPMPGPTDLQGRAIAPEILAAMDEMRRRRDMPGVQTTGEQVEAQFRARPRPRALWA